MTKHRGGRLKAVPSADYDPVEEVLTISGADYYLHVRVSPEQLRSLSEVDDASWDNRTSTKAGEALGYPAFWCRDIEDPSRVVVLLGPDDETWELSLRVPAAILKQVLRPIDPGFERPREIGER